MVMSFLGDATQAVMRMVQLIVVRRAPALVWRDKKSGGWVHRYRGGTVVSPTPRGRPMGLIAKDTDDVFFHAYRPTAGDVVVELGAEYGTETVVLSKAVGPRGRVVAIEAHPWTAQLLGRTVELSSLSNVTVVNAAAVATHGSVWIENSTDANMISNSVVAGQRTVEVEGLTLKDIAERFGLARIDLLKVNIEGAERNLFDDDALSTPQVRHAVISCHDFRAEAGDGEVFRTGEVVDKALRRHGWEVARRLGDSRPWVRHYRYASNPTDA